MTIYFAGTSIADLSGNTGATATTSSTNATTAVCREGVLLTGSSLVTTFIDLPSSPSDMYFTFRMKVVGTTSGTALNVLEFFDTSVSTTQGLVRVRKTATFNSTDGMSFDYWNGSAWTSIATFTSSSSITNLTVRIKLDDSTGVIQLWYGGANVGSLTGDTKFTSSTTINRITSTGGGAAGGSDWAFSEVVIANVDTTNFRVAALWPTGNGTNTAWTNDYTTVDETGADDTDYISGAANGDKETYAMQDIDSSVSTSDVEALVVSMRARKGGSGPQNLQAALYISGADYASSSVSGLTTAFGPVQAVFATNPATSSNWSQSAVNGAEIGVKAIT